MANASKLVQHARAIRTYIRKSKKAIYSLIDLEQLLAHLKQQNLAGFRSSVEDLLDTLEAHGFVFNTITITSPSVTPITRYCLGKVDDLALLQSLSPYGYFSHGTALHLQGLSQSLSADLYLTLEQYQQKENKTKMLEQTHIDAAFEKPQRSSSVQYHWHGYTLHLLHKKTTRLAQGIEKTGMNKYTITNLERTLLDATTRPAYVGGVEMVLEAYIKAKGKLDTEKLFRYYKQAKFIYPYHQAIGFYLTRAGYPEKQISPFTTLPRLYQFYLDYGMKEKKFDPSWQIHYPKNL